MWYKSEKLRLVLNYCMAGLLNHNPGNYIVKENLIAVLCVVTGQSVWFWKILGFILIQRARSDQRVIEKCCSLEIKSPPVEWREV